MNAHDTQLAALLKEMEKLHRKKLLSMNLPENYFEPGEMEYLDQYDAVFFDGDSTWSISFEVKGTQYEGRTEEIERVHVGDPVIVLRDKDNLYNPNNFRIMSNKKRDLGNMPAELCNVIAPLFDEGRLQLTLANVSFVEPISARNRYARKAVLFITLKGVMDLVNKA